MGEGPRMESRLMDEGPKMDNIRLNWLASRLMDGGGTQDGEKNRHGHQGMEQPHRDQQHHHLGQGCHIYLGGRTKASP